MTGRSPSDLELALGTLLRTARHLESPAQDGQNPAPLLANLRISYERGQPEEE